MEYSDLFIDDTNILNQVVKRERESESLLSFYVHGTRKGTFRENLLSKRWNFNFAAHLASNE